MAHDPFQYIFRFCCDPGFNDDTEVPALLRYVDEARIDDVAVFANVEELNTGHMSFEEQDVYLALMRKLTVLLAEKGVTMSVNQWHSVMHADLGKHFAQGQHFRPMVDPAGRASALCVCPLCENWQAYIARLYARYAELDPSILWVEDDFRLHNHAPLEWGGCFCDEHMKLYSARAGKALTREEFVRGVLQPGEPHPYRKIWLDVSRDTMLSAAGAIGRAVRAVSPRAKVGLMSSAPHIHAAEGRDWHALLHALAAGAVPVDRVHLPGYQEASPSAYMHGFNMVSMLTRAMLPPETEVYPELENFPFSRFSKSRRFTRFQLLAALPLDLAGITIDLYDLNGNGIVWEDGYQQMLRDTKDYLNLLTRMGVFKGRRLGVQVLYSPCSAYTLHTSAGRHMEELYPREAFFAGLLPAMGVPYTYCADISVAGQVVAASGQVLRNWTSGQLAHLFQNNFVILDGDALDTLCSMGLGHLAGVESVRWLAQDSGAYTYEQVTGGRVYCGRKNARASAVLVAGDALDVTYAPGAQVEEYTALFDSFRRRTAPCQAVVNGRVLVYPFGHLPEPPAIPCMLLNSMRQAVLQDVLRAAHAPFPLVEGAPYLEPYCFADAKGLHLYLINASLDDVGEVCLSLDAPPAAARAWFSHRAAPASLTCAGGGRRVCLPVSVPALETALLTFPPLEGTE